MVPSVAIQTSTFDVGVPRHPRAALLVAQAGQCSCRAAEVGASRCARGAQRIYNAEDIDKARVVIKAFEIDYGAKYPKAVAKIVADADVLLSSIAIPRRALDPPGARP